MSRRFSEEEMHMANRHMKRCSTLLNIREMQAKTVTSCHLTPIRKAITKMNTKNKCWRGCGEREPLYTIGVNVN